MHMAHTVLLVEDDPRIRERLAAIISAHPALELLAAAGTYAEARAWLSKRAPDVLLVDLGMPDGDGGELIPPALQAGARVVVLTVFHNGSRLGAALAAGAYGCMYKDSSAQVITETLTNLFAAQPVAEVPTNHEFM
jgi:DNA-binding NarL/FixJ family response regulator